MENLNRRNVLTMTTSLATFFMVSRIFAQELPPEAPALPPQVKKSVEVIISKNHGHNLILDRSELFTGLTRQYEIQGESRHPHTIEMNAERDLALARSGVIEIESSTDVGHSHLVTIMLKELCE